MWQVTIIMFLVVSPTFEWSFRCLAHPAKKVAVMVYFPAFVYCIHPTRRSSKAVSSTQVHSPLPWCWWRVKVGAMQISWLSALCLLTPSPLWDWCNKYLEWVINLHLWRISLRCIFIFQLRDCVNYLFSITLPVCCCFLFCLTYICVPDYKEILNTQPPTLNDTKNDLIVKCIRAECQ